MINKKILHYKILEELGRGGMGVVYLAEDSKLNRKVAIKFLPPHIAVNKTDRERFKIEAQAAAALSHPNIATIHAIEEDEDNIFIVMEYIEGKELKDVLRARHAVPQQQTLDNAIQIAKGLNAAHKKGIIHRDIKSSNIMVTEDGAVKIMDFGLAKIGEGLQLTKTHSTLGTTAYMSPEQTQGETAGQQSDIWSFGVVVYEMLTGKLPFAGRHEPAIIYSITNEQPALKDIEHEALRAIVNKCLQKDKKDRYTSIEQVLNDLMGEKQPSSVIAPSDSALIQKTAGYISLNKGIAAASLVFMIILYFVLFDWIPGDEGPAMKTRRLTSYPGLEAEPALSPDGKQVAFSWNGPEQNNFDIYVQRIDGGNPLRLTTIRGFETEPQWSPDGRYIAFAVWAEYNVYDLYRVPSLGGREQKITRFNTAGNSPKLSWGKGSSYIYYPMYADEDSAVAIHRVSLDDLKVEKLHPAPAGIVADNAPAVSADGRYVGFIRKKTGDNSDIFIHDLSNAEIRKVTDVQARIAGFSWGTDNGTILFTANLDGTDAIWKTDLDGTEPKKVLSGISIRSPDYSVAGKNLVYQEYTSNSNIWKLDLRNSHKKETMLIQSSFDNLHPDISPDGKRIVFSSNRAGTFNIWLCESDGSNPTQLTFVEKKTRPGWAIWSPLNDEIMTYFGGATVYVVKASGGALKEVGDVGVYPTWQRDGRGFYGSPIPAYNLDAFSLVDKKRRQITKGTGLNAIAHGDFLYYVKHYGITDIWRVSRNGENEQVVLQGYAMTGKKAWALSTSGIYFMHYKNNSIVLSHYDFESKQVRDIKELPDARGGIAVDPEEKYLLYAKMEPSKSDIILVENFIP